MKKLSRVLGVTLSLALLLQCVLFSGIPSKAETSSSVRNPGFENGTDTDVYDWGLYPNWQADNITSDTVHGGSRAVKVELSETQNYALFAGGYNSEALDVSAALTLTAWVKYENLSGGFCFGVERKANNANVADSFSGDITGTSDGWVQIKHEIPLTEQSIDELIIKFEIRIGSGTLVIDDVELTVNGVQNILKNSSFEIGNDTEASDWGYWPGWQQGIIDTETVYSGNRAIKIEMSGDTNYSLYSCDYPVESYAGIVNKLEASVMMKYENVTEGNVYIHINRGGAPQFNSDTYYLSGSSNGWIELKFEVPADPGATRAQFQIEISSGRGTIWFDDAVLCESTSNLINYAAGFNAGFETIGIENGVTKANDWGMYPSWQENALVTNEASHSGCNSVRITLNETQNYAFWRSGFNNSMFDVNQALVASAWVMVPVDAPVTGILYLGFERDRYDLIGERLENFTTNGEWVRITRVLPVNDQTAAGLTLKAEMSSGTGTIYFDDIEFYPVPTASLSESQNEVILDNDDVRAGDIINITAAAVENKIAHIYQDGVKLNALGSIYHAVMSEGNTALTVSYDDPIKGDANDDGNVDIRDLVRLKKYFAGLADTTLLSADMNGDGKLMTDDLVELRKALLVL